PVRRPGPPRHGLRAGAAARARSDLTVELAGEFADPRTDPGTCLTPGPAPGRAGPRVQSSPEHRSHAACFDTPSAGPMRVQLTPRPRQFMRQPATSRIRLL